MKTPTDSTQAVQGTDPVASGDRLLTFEVSGSVYALPIAAVLEVAETDRICCVPSVPGGSGGVLNWHGDALPVVAPHLILAPEDGQAPEFDVASESTPEHVLVVSDRSGHAACLGIPIDRVLGLVDQQETSGRARGLVIERRPVDGRVVAVLDPGQLVARAREVIEQSVH